MQGNTSPCCVWHTTHKWTCVQVEGGRKGDTRIGDQAQPLLPHRQSSPQQGHQDGQRTSCHHHRSSRWSRSSPPPLSGAGTHQRTQQTYGSMNWKLSTPKTWPYLLGFLTLVTVFQGFEAGLWQYLEIHIHVKVGNFHIHKYLLSSSNAFLVSILLCSLYSSSVNNFTRGLQRFFLT